ncbi:MAG: hypothetical protein MHM6MM_003564 [Cercozoa sp. M6MM]
MRQRLRVLLRYALLLLLAVGAAGEVVRYTGEHAVLLRSPFAAASAVNHDNTHGSRSTADEESAPIRLIEFHLLSESMSMLRRYEVRGHTRGGDIRRTGTLFAGRGQFALRGVARVVPVPVHCGSDTEQQVNASHATQFLRLPNVSLALMTPQQLTDAGVTDSDNARQRVALDHIDAASTASMTLPLAQSWHSFEFELHSATTQHIALVLTNPLSSLRAVQSRVCAAFKVCKGHWTDAVFRALRDKSRLVDPPHDETPLISRTVSDAVDGVGEEGQDEWWTEPVDNPSDCQSTDFSQNDCADDVKQCGSWTDQECWGEVNLCDTDGENYCWCPQWWVCRSSTRRRDDLDDRDDFKSSDPALLELLQWFDDVSQSSQLTADERGYLPVLIFCLALESIAALAFIFFALRHYKSWFSSLHVPLLLALLLAPFASLLQIALFADMDVSGLPPAYAWRQTINAVRVLVLSLLLLAPAVLARRVVLDLVQECGDTLRQHRRLRHAGTLEQPERTASDLEGSCADDEDATDSALSASLRVLRRLDLATYTTATACLWLLAVLTLMSARVLIKTPQAAPDSVAYTAMFTYMVRLCHTLRQVRKALQQRLSPIVNDSASFHRVTRLQKIKRALTLYAIGMGVLLLLGWATVLLRLRLEQKNPQHPIGTLLACLTLRLDLSPGSDGLLLLLLSSVLLRPRKNLQLISNSDAAHAGDLELPQLGMCDAIDISDEGSGALPRDGKEDSFVADQHSNLTPETPFRLALGEPSELTEDDEDDLAPKHAHLRLYDGL